MRLQLDSLTSAPAGLTGTGATGLAGKGTQKIGGQGADGHDSSYVSGPSSILNRFAADRTARVQQLTEQVQSGSYQVSGSAVSQAIVDQSLLQA